MDLARDHRAADRERTARKNYSASADCVLLAAIGVEIPRDEGNDTGELPLPAAPHSSVLRADFLPVSTCRLCNPFLDGAMIYACRGLRVSREQLWPEAKRYP